MKRTSLLTILALCTTMVAGCAKEEAAPSPPPQQPAKVTGAGTLTEGFSTPESVLYDADQDVYFVSNINGAPLDQDGNGYISRINAETREVDAKWIDGEKEGITLSAPKGMTITGDTLWVTDINAVRKFDRKTGEPLGEIAFEGATFMNDLSTGDDGSVYATDTGMKAGAEGFEPSGTDAVYRIAPDGSVETLISGDDLGRPNGVVATADGVWVVTFGSNQLYMVSGGEKTNVVELPAGSLDGLVLLEGGDVLISSWEAKSIYRGPVAGPFEVVIDKMNAPADIGFDTKRELVLIPRFSDNFIVLKGLE